VSAHPEIDVQLREETPEEMLSDLYGGRLDAATLAAMPGMDAGRLRFRSLGREPLVLITATEARREAAASRVPHSMVPTWVSKAPGSAVRDVMASALAWPRPPSCARSPGSPDSPSG
jgi:DNA-binding transcriptional LysR family regulator